jgi:hypothetical protein
MPVGDRAGAVGHDREARRDALARSGRPLRRALASVDTRSTGIP